MKRTMLLIAAAIPALALADGSADTVARGKYIVTTSGCNDCHTPWVMGAKGPEPDMTRMLSGHPSDFPLTPAPKVSGGRVMVAAATNTAWIRKYFSGNSGNSLNYIYNLICCTS